MTGKDEHQESFPLTRFVAFGDYKAPTYIYLDVPFVALFGKTEFAVRLPSIIFGTATVVLTFFFIRLLLSQYEKKETIALFSAFFLAISPWHIQLSRAAYEGNIATFFTVLAAFLFYYALQKKSWMLLVSAVSFVIAFYSFNAHRVFIPLLVLMLSIVYWKDLLEKKKIVLLATILGVLLLIPFCIYFLKPESRLRFQEVNIFTDFQTVKKANDLIADDNNSVFSKVIHNRRVLFSKEYLANYFDFFNPTYLFFTGDVNPRFSDRENGQLYLWMVPLLILGGYTILLKKQKSTYVLVGWFLLAPLAAATARETPHALRSETFIPMYEVIAAVGMSTHVSYLKKYAKHFLVIPAVVYSMIVVFSLFFFCHNYFIHNPIINSYDWQYGYKQMIAKVTSLEKSYDKVYVTNAYGRAYIYFAWYGNYTPQKFWNDVDMRVDAFGLYNVPRLGKYYFTETYTEGDKGKILYVTLPTMVPKDAKKIDEIPFLNGDKAFIISTKSP